MAKFDGRSTADEVVASVDLTKKRILVTGATAGIGLETARALAAGGATVHLGARSAAKGEAARDTILARHPDADVELFEVDLGSLESVRAAAAGYEPETLDAIICNAGVYGGGYATTADGFERVVGVCHLGHFLLVSELLPQLEASGAGRVVMVASDSHRTPKRLDFDKLPLTEKTHSDLLAYAQAKLCNVLFANELGRRMEGRSVTANALHPGTLISTSIDRSSFMAKVVMTLAKPFVRSLAQGAATSCYVATAPELAGVSGKYFDKCREVPASKEARDERVAARLWELTEGWVGLGQPNA